MAQLRAKKANLLGFDTWAAYAVADQMAKTPTAVYEILDDLAPKALAHAKADAADIQAEIKRPAVILNYNLGIGLITPRKCVSKSTPWMRAASNPTLNLTLC